jgi:hypothetical protein
MEIVRTSQCCRTGDGARRLTGARVEASIADPDPFDTDPDPAFHFDTGPDPAFQFDTDPDPYRFKEVMYLKQYFLHTFT